MRTNIPRTISNLHSLSRGQLLAMWQKFYGKTAPSGIRRELVIPFLAYRIQENMHGGLKTSTCSELRRIARALENSARSGKLILQPRIKPGTRLLREWRGRHCEVLVTETGYDYRGVRYRSLSEIARKVTGTRWSGPAFFGLKKANSASCHRDE